MDEYQKFTNISIDLAEPIFNAYDSDGDGVISNNFLTHYLDLMDTNGKC